MKNLTEATTHLADTTAKTAKGEASIGVLAATANAIGTMARAVRTQIEYARARGEKPEIEFAK